MSVSTPALDGAPAMGGLFLALRRGAPRVAISPDDDDDDGRDAMDALRDARTTRGRREGRGVRCDERRDARGVRGGTVPCGSTRVRRRARGRCATARGAHASVPSGLGTRDGYKRSQKFARQNLRCYFSRLSSSPIARWPSLSHPPLLFFSLRSARVPLELVVEVEIELGRGVHLERLHGHLGDRRAVLRVVPYERTSEWS
jgi:hypothetical protein